MDFFTVWWETLSPLQQVFAYIAIPATVIMLLQTILLLFGMGSNSDHDIGGSFDGDHDVDFDMDTDMDVDADMDADFDASDGHDGVFGQDHSHAQEAFHDSGLRVFTVRGLVAFFAFGGWLGVALPRLGMPDFWVAAIAFAGGTGALLLVAWVMKMSLKLQDQGNIDINNALGKTANVYITIPGNLSGRGKITLTLQERFVELDAMTKQPEPIKAGTLVSVSGSTDNDALLVESLADGTAKENL